MSSGSNSTGSDAMIGHRGGAGQLGPGDLDVLPARASGAERLRGQPEREPVGQGQPDRCPPDDREELPAGQPDVVAPRTRRQHGQLRYKDDRDVEDHRRGLAPQLTACAVGVPGMMLHEFDAVAQGLMTTSRSSVISLTE